METVDETLCAVDGPLFIRALEVEPVEAIFDEELRQTLLDPHTQPFHFSEAGRVERTFERYRVEVIRDVEQVGELLADAGHFHPRQDGVVILDVAITRVAHPVAVDGVHSHGLTARYRGGLPDIAGYGLPVPQPLVLFVGSWFKACFVAGLRAVAWCRTLAVNADDNGDKYCQTMHFC